jgi:hypothetical protein
VAGSAALPMSEIVVVCVMTIVVKLCAIAALVYGRPARQTA